jgi:hypothetical protein
MLRRCKRLSRQLSTQGKLLADQRKAETNLDIPSDTVKDTDCYLVVTAVGKILELSKSTTLVSIKEAHEDDGS